MTRRPAVALGVLGVVVVVPLVDAWRGGTFLATPVGVLACVAAGFLLGAWVRPSYAGAACLLGAAGLTMANQQVQPGRYHVADDLFFFLVVLGGTALAGALVSARSAQVRELRRLTALRAKQRAVEVRAAALEERNRLETEVTEAMAQRIGAVVVHASGALAAGVRADAAAPQRLEGAARAALDDLRSALGSLRYPEHPADPVPAPSVRPRRRPGLGDALVGLSGVPVAVEAFLYSPTLLSLLGLLLGAPLVWRRSHPVVAVAVAYAAAVVTSLLVLPVAGWVTPLLPFSIGAYAVGAHARGWQRLAGVVVLLVGGAAVTISGTGVLSEGLDEVAWLPALAWLAVAVVAGVVAAQHAARAERLADLLARLEAGRDGDLRLAAAEQRQAVARDLHDTVAHAMTVVCLHAEAAQRARDDTARRESLQVVEQAARGALQQLRAGLEVLDPDDRFADHVRALAATLGVPVSVRCGVEPVGAAAPVLRRVVREALVNAARHAPGVPVTVAVSGHGPVALEVTNPPARGASYPLGSGSGLAGLTTLVEERGGRLEAGPTPDGGWRVCAVVPQVTGVPA